MQALRESSDERAQDAYALLVEAIVSGNAEDIAAARRAMEGVKHVVRPIAKLPSPCHNDTFHPIHDTAFTTAIACGVSLEDSPLSEERSRDVRSSVAYLSVIVLLVVLCVLFHSWVQKCKPSHLCAPVTNAR